MKNFQDLFDFVDRAIKSRKYPENTGMSLKTALKLFEVQLNEEEKASISEFKKNLEQIYQTVFSKNKDFSSGSLATYKSRVVKVLKDYEKYGVDPNKMTGWSPKVITRTKKEVITKTNEDESISRITPINGNGGFHSFDFSGIKLLIPRTTKTTDAVMDGELKQIKIELKKFADTFCEKESKILEVNNE